MLYILVGLPATGKSEVAKMLSERTGAVVLNEDQILRELYPEQTHSTKERQSVYDEMFRRAADLLNDNKDVVLDATFISKANRDKARSLGKYQIIEVTAPEDQIKKRLEKRYHPDGNDADWKVHLKYKKNFEPIEEQHLVIDNSQSLEKLEKQLDRVITNL